MQKEDVSREEYQRIFQRCRWRALNIAKLTNRNDVRAFIEECMLEELKEGKQKRLTKEQRLKRPKKLVTKQKRREQKPRKHVIIYKNVTPSEPNPILEDFFVHVENLEPSKREQLDRFMDSHEGKVDYETLMAKLRVRKMTDFRLKKCPICQKYWCYINDDMCSSCKEKGYHVEEKRMENPIGFYREETKILVLPRVVKKKNDERKR